MFRGESLFNSADLVEGDTLAVSAYFCYFFMIAYKYRQAKAVVDRIVSCHLYLLQRKCIFQCYNDKLLLLLTTLLVSLGFYSSNCQRMPAHCQPSSSKVYRFHGAQTKGRDWSKD